ncbi:MAG: L-lactate permease, partial [Planctomycetota bacterium]
MTLRVRPLRLPLPAHVALPAAAVLALLAQAFFGHPPTDPASAGEVAASLVEPSTSVLLAARVVEGLLTALMPLAIVFGAILLFKTLDASGAMRTLTATLERSAPDPVIRVVLIAWAFSYLVEGLSGFGTPAALAAPILVALGLPPVRAASACLVMNTVPVVFGAVGMPVWFGLGETDLDEQSLVGIGVAAATFQAAAAPVIVALALRALFPWADLKRRALPIAFILVATLVPSAIAARFSTEFPSIIGGLTGLAAAFALGRTTRSRTEATPTEHNDRPSPPDRPELSLWRAAFPLAATVLLLAVTRLEPIGVKPLLNAVEPAITLELPTVGTLSVSAALVTRVDAILGTPISWSMPVLYVPFVIPFVVVSVVSVPLLGMRLGAAAGVWSRTASSLAKPAIALAGALVFVKLMMHGQDASPVITLGETLAAAVAAVHAELWLAAAPLLGALGSFFSGSATVSNLTFAPVQTEIAARLGLDPTRVLALQAV